MEITQATNTASVLITAKPTSSTAISSDFETFLRMLTVQMENQDPLNPVDSSDYAVQLATFSGVEQQVQTNDLLRSLAIQLGASGMAQMASWVGKEARSPAAAQFDGNTITLTPKISPLADRAEIVVSNANGAEVDRFDVPVGAETVDWSGADRSGFPLPLGLYSFSVSSYSGEEVLTKTPAEIYSTVTEVRSQNGETVLILKGGAAIASSQVTALRDPSL